MPILHNAHKALRVSKRKAASRQPIKSKVKTMTDVMKSKPTGENLSSAFSAIDRAVKRNIFHKKQGARLKSHLSKLMTTGEKPAKVAKEVKTVVAKSVKATKVVKTAKSVKSVK